MRNGRVAHRADDLDERQGDLGVPLLWGLEDEVVERLADLWERKRAASARKRAVSGPARAVRSGGRALVFWP